mmetsp:Transcript_11414/g.16123  ORF Transcript_11414/g.16123 Transcript_11414/m.16123 type:complete len:345 (+) Transcript_11414:646-1680(+)
MQQATRTVTHGENRASMTSPLSSTITFQSNANQVSTIINNTSKSALIPINVESCSTELNDDAEPPPDDIDVTTEEYAKMTPEARRRLKRNLREQHRSYKISQQIKELRNVLTESSIPFKPNKYSILQSVVEYIKQLQVRAIFLDNEHSKLIQTIRQTTEMVNAPSNSHDLNSSETNWGLHNNSSYKTEKDYVDVGNDLDLLFVQGLDYKEIFGQTSAALGVAALDGRFLACNPEFELISGYSAKELTSTSLFNLLSAQDVEEVFKVMGEMLKEKNENQNIQTKADGNTKDDDPDLEMHNYEFKTKTYWSGKFMHQKSNKLSINITLTRSSDGMPIFFNCALTSG